jgi:SAM-dependent methyltransferase
MADWGSGYVTDTAYVHDYCRAQTPPILGFAALCRGIVAPGSMGEPLRYCDLGCGQGFTANIIAAANSRADVFAADFNPTHIANARGLAQAAGLKNITFREADFAELADDASLPEFDIIALHGPICVDSVTAGELDCVARRIQWNSWFDNQIHSGKEGSRRSLPARAQQGAAGWPSAKCLKT